MGAVATVAPLRANPQAATSTTTTVVRIMNGTNSIISDPRLSLTRRSAAEFLGTALLLIAVVGSGIAAEQLSPDDNGVALLINAIATGAALVAIITALGPVSGAHVNPAVTIAAAWRGDLDRGDVPGYVFAQVAGGALGTVIANLMFSLDAIDLATTERTGGGLALAEVVATFGLLLVIFGAARTANFAVVGAAVGAYIAGAYFFTSSTSFANPAVTLARTLSDTFAGIDPGSVPAFLAAQLVAVPLAVGAAAMVFPRK